MSNQKGYLDVGDGHQLYYETYGIPKGIPVLYLHGGPGFGFTEGDKDFFDPKIFHAILYDQRGASRSTPYGSLENNTPKHLVSDITKILDFFEIEKTILFGGSWGSTLALLYAIENPSRVTGMILRGIFPGTAEAIRHFAQGAVGLYYPKAWERFVGMVPEEKRQDVAAYYFQMMQAEEENLRLKYAFEWAFYGFSISRKVVNYTDQEITTMIKNEPFLAHGLMEACYSVNNCFLPDNFIYENVGKLQNIPISITHGRFDVICPPVFAYRLHQKLPQSKLFFVDAGHSAYEVETAAKLKSELIELATSL